MKVVRCPECGNRLTNSYCPMCMKHVPFPNQTKGTPWQQRKYMPKQDVYYSLQRFLHIPLLGEFLPEEIG